jgi:hypothetical protein
LLHFSAPVSFFHLPSIVYIFFQSSFRPICQRHPPHSTFINSFSYIFSFCFLILLPLSSFLLVRSFSPTFLVQCKNECTCQNKL